MEAINLIVKALENNPLTWGMLYFPHHFRKESPPFHLKILKEALTNRFLAIAAPRESAKSTILAFLYMFHMICFRKKRFIVIVSNTYKKSCTSLDNIKKEIRENEKIRNDFPMVISKDAEGDSIFRHPNGFEIRILCKGAEQIGSVRGEKFGAYRPDLIIVDDVEDDEMIKNPERRAELQELYDQALIPAGEQGVVQVLVIGTILHDDSQMAKLVSKRYYPEYRKLLYKALYEVEGKEFSLWEEKWTLADLHKLRQDKPDVFAKEYQNNPVAGLMAKFHKEDFRYWKIENLRYVLFDREGGIVGSGNLSDCKAAIACDLAWEEGRQNDYSVVLPAFLTPQSDILVDNYICKKGLREDEMWEILTTMESRLKALTGVPIPIGFEKAKLEKVMKHLLKKEMRKYNKFLWFKDLQWDSDKITRIETRLQARYSQHVIYHRQGMGELELQLTRFPSGVHDDLCLVGDTLILTNNGNIELQYIQVGDRVMTRDGFKKVIKKQCTGIKEVITNIGLTGTSNHPIITKNGIKTLDKVIASDILYIWNEKQSCIEEKSITDTLLQKEDNIESIFGDTTNGKVLHFHYIDRFGLITLEQYRRVISFITKMIIPLITNYPIWNVGLFQNICHIIPINQKEFLQQKRTSTRALYPTREKIKLVNGIKVKQDTNGISHTVKKAPVFNLRIESNHEYFANNILVHNCDALQGAVQLLSNPKTIQSENLKETEFDWIRRKTMEARFPERKKYVFGNKHQKYIGIPAKESYR